MLHPVFRLMALVGLGACLFRYSLAGQLLVLAGILGLTAWRGRDGLAGSWRALRRIRWLLLSIAVIYLWVAPEPDAGTGWLPAWTEIELALRRAGVLVVLVSAVELMRQVSRPEETAAALTVLLAPARHVGLDATRFARRLALTLDEVPRTAETVAAAARSEEIRRRSLGDWGRVAAGLIRRIEEDAASRPAIATLPALAWPGPGQWAALAMVLTTLLLVTRV